MFKLTNRFTIPKFFELLTPENVTYIRKSSMFLFQMLDLRTNGDYLYSVKTISSSITIIFLNIIA